MTSRTQEIHLVFFPSSQWYHNVDVMRLFVVVTSVFCFHWQYGLPARRNGLGSDCGSLIWPHIYGGNRVQRETRIKITEGGEGWGRGSLFLCRTCATGGEGGGALGLGNI